MAFELARLAAELEARRIDNPGDFLEEGDEDRVAAWIAHFDAERRRRPRLGAGMLATWLRSNEWPPGHDPAGDGVDRRGGDEARAWAITRVPDLTTTAVVGALMALRYSRREFGADGPTPEEVREHVIAKWTHHMGSPDAAIRSTYTQAERAQMKAEDDQLRARRPDLFAPKAVPA